MVHLITKRVLRSRKFWYAAGGLFVLAALFSGFFMVKGTIVAEKRQQVTFYQISDGAYGREPAVDVFNSRYAGVRGDIARIGNYKFEMKRYGKNDAGEGCFILPKVTQNGDVVDSYDLQGRKVQIYALEPDKHQSAEYGGIKAEFGNPFYMEYETWNGNGQVYAYSVDCFGPMNRYSLSVPFKQIQVESSIPGNVTEGGEIVVETRVENSWKPLEADLKAEVCVAEVFCRNTSKQDVDIPVGGKTIRFTVVNENKTRKLGEASVDLRGSIGIDTDKYTLQNVAVDCDADGRNEKPSECEMVEIGEIQDTGVVSVLKEQGGPETSEKDLNWLDRKLKVLIKFLTFN